MAVRTKICGITRPADAATAARAGADFLGVVTVGGPRLVAPELIREIVAAADGVPVLAVVRPASADLLIELTGSTGLAGVQLHGRAAPGVVEALRAAGRTVWQSLALGRDEPVEESLAIALAGVDAVLVEPSVAGRSGGLGVRLDPELAARARRAIPAGRMVLAGGLDPGNVAAAVSLIRPDAVDVSSGVESAPGHKDRARMARFLEAVREACSTG